MIVQATSAPAQGQARWRQHCDELQRPLFRYRFAPLRYAHSWAPSGLRDFSPRGSNHYTSRVREKSNGQDEPRRRNRAEVRFKRIRPRIQITKICAGVGGPLLFPGRLVPAGCAAAVWSSVLVVGFCSVWGCFLCLLWFSSWFWVASFRFCGWSAFRSSSGLSVVLACFWAGGFVAPVRCRWGWCASSALVVFSGPFGADFSLGVFVVLSSSWFGFSSVCAGARVFSASGSPLLSSGAGAAWAALRGVPVPPAAGSSGSSGSGASLPPAPAVVPAAAPALRCFGLPVASAPVVVVFAFRWAGSWASVRVGCASRSSAARLLRRFRAARRAVRALRLPLSVVWASRFPRFSLRWLACLRVRVGVFASSGLVGRASWVRAASARVFSAFALRVSCLGVAPGSPAACAVFGGPAPAPSPAPSPAPAPAPGSSFVLASLAALPPARLASLRGLLSALRG